MVAVVEGVEDSKNRGSILPAGQYTIYSRSTCSPVLASQHSYPRSHRPCSRGISTMYLRLVNVVRWIEQTDAASIQAARILYHSCCKYMDK